MAGVKHLPLAQNHDAHNHRASQSTESDVVAQHWLMKADVAKLKAAHAASGKTAWWKRSAEKPSITETEYTYTKPGEWSAPRTPNPEKPVAPPVAPLHATRTAYCHPDLAAIPAALKKQTEADEKQLDLLRATLQELDENKQADAKEKVAALEEKLESMTIRLHKYDRCKYGVELDKPETIRLVAPSHRHVQQREPEEVLCGEDGSSMIEESIEVQCHEEVVVEETIETSRRINKSGRFPKPRKRNTPSIAS